MRKPSPGFAEHVLLRHLHALEHELTGGRAVQAELGLDGARGDALHLLRLDDEGGHALIAGRPVGTGVEQAGIAEVRLRDPHLVAVHLVVVALVDGVRLHAGDVRAGVGLGHGEETELRAGDPAGDVLLSLLRRTGFGDGESRTKVLHVERQPPGRRNLGDLLGHQYRFHEAHAAAAEGFGQRAGEEAELAHLGHAIGAELVFALLLLECRCDLLGGESLAVSWISRCSSFNSKFIAAPLRAIAIGASWMIDLSSDQIAL